MEKNSKILVLGSTGLVGSAIVRELKKQGYSNIHTIDRKKDGILHNYTWNNFDLRDYDVTVELFKKVKPEYVFNAAGKVGGIHANDSQSADFTRDNLLIQINVVNACHNFKVKKLLNLGSSCIYPKECKIPIKEEYLMTGPLEETNKGYAVAKIAGITLCQMYHKQYGDNFISVMPTNLYGQNDNFNLKNSHVLPATIRKFHEAKINNAESVEIWGSGNPMREFLHVDDLAEGLIFLMNNYNDPSIINIGTGIDVSIKTLAESIKKITGFKGNIVWNDKYPDGTMRKLLDVSKIKKLGWKHKINLYDGIKQTYDWFIENYDSIKK